jgi:hypothetical protein
MNNIHVISTSKPSKLLKDLVDKTYQFKKYFTFGNRIELPLNIYITSDEEIKEGDWVLGDFPDNPIGKVIAKYGQEFTAQSLNGDKYGLAEYDSKKIILTTDQDLINDGVQAIPDEFLEWFVNNSTCEEVKVLKYKSNNMRKMNLGYKIILPKEEPKQETLSWDELVQEAENKEELIKILKLPHIAPLVREAMRNNCKK